MKNMTITTKAYGKRKIKMTIVRAQKHPIMHRKESENFIKPEDKWKYKDFFFFC